MRLKYILPIFALVIIFSACNNDDDNNNVDDYDAAAQSLIDDASLIEYLKTHYYIPAVDDEIFGVIDTILNNETALFDDDKLIAQEIIENEVDFTIYHYIEREGLNNAPEKTDSVLVNYRGFLLDSTKFDERLNYIWLSLTSVIRGWSHGFVKYKDGTNATQANNPLKFDNTGNGIMFIPSGLAYANIGTAGIGANEPLIFYINLGLVERSDHDNDLVFSNIEDVDQDGNPNNDDTDEDGVPNYFDVDDDNDRILTRDEDVDGDGDPTNDDTDNDGIKNYLDDDDDGDGTLTIDEDANGDGDPRNDDTDNDGIPDYLDTDNS